MYMIYTEGEIWIGTFTSTNVMNKTLELHNTDKGYPSDKSCI